MDSITQLALGAAVGEATLGRQVGRRALMWGAVCGTIPDLDVFIPLGDAVKDFTYHRSASHSLLVLAALTPLVVWLILKIHPHTRDHRWRWFALVYLAFATHALLDSFTVYGTQIFWPVSDTPMTWSTIFIIDPLYTLPLLVGIIAAAITAQKGRWGYAVNTAGLVLSTGYLVWTLGAKLYVNHEAVDALKKQNIMYTGLLTVPSPFNSLLWRVLAVNDTNYYEGYYSLLDKTNDIVFDVKPRSLELIQPIQDTWPVQRLQWFSKDFYAVSQINDDIVMTDLRMGSGSDYVFQFKVGESGNPHVHSAPVERIESNRDFSRLNWVWRRIWDKGA